MELNTVTTRFILVLISKTFPPVDLRSMMRIPNFKPLRISMCLRQVLVLSTSFRLIELTNIRNMELKLGYSHGQIHTSFNIICKSLSPLGSEVQISMRGAQILFRLTSFRLMSSRLLKIVLICIHSGLRYERRRKAREFHELVFISLVTCDLDTKVILQTGFSSPF